MEDSPIACTLTDDEFRQRRAHARETILPLVSKYQSIEKGLEIEFKKSPDTAVFVKEFIELEKGCCGFLNFDLSPETQSKSNQLSLQITGPNGAAQFIDKFVQLIEEQNNARSAT